MELNAANYHLGNLILILAALSWAVAQVLKVVIQLLTKDRKSTRLNSSH